MKKSKLAISIVSLLLLSGCGNAQFSTSLSFSNVPSSSESSIVASSETGSASSKSQSDSSKQSSSDSSFVSSSVSPSSSSQPSRLSPFTEPDLSKQVNLFAIGDIFTAWENYRGSGVTIAVIDSGFDIYHPEFHYTDGTSKIKDTSASFSYNGNDVSVQTGVSNVMVTDGDSHGTFCACVAAGSISGSGTVGIAPEADLLLLKTDKKPKSIAQAFHYAADNGAKVITISIGSYSDYDGDLINDGSDLTSCFDEATTYAYNKGVVVCSAAGNGGGSSRATEYTYPGASAHVIGCGGLAYNEDDTIWSGSSYNSSPDYEFCDIFAPSENLYNGAYLNGKSTYDGGWNGTSFSSPQVAGAAALYFEKNPTANAADFERDLYASAAPLSDANHTGHGRLDVGVLLNAIPAQKDVNVSFVPSSWWSQDGAVTYAYLWNGRTRQEKANWPGIRLDSLGTFDCTEYDSLILSRCSSSGEDWGARTIHISPSIFAYCSSYSLANTPETWYGDSGPAIGTMAI